jgi:hypothetical protein
MHLINFYQNTLKINNSSFYREDAGCMHVMTDEGQDLHFLTLSLVVNLFVTMLLSETEAQANFSKKMIKCFLSVLPCYLSLKWVFLFLK